MADILIIEDSSFMRGILRKMLEQHGHTVREASNGRLGLEAIRESCPACATIDIAMPEMDGLELLQNIQELGLDMNIVMVSADIQDSTRERCIEFGANTFLNKPPGKTN